MQEISSIKKNILKFIDYKGISKYKFYQMTSITRGVLDQNSGMSEENTAKFLAYFTEVNPEWLLTGVGEMLRASAPVAVRAVAPQQGIPLIPVAAMAGYGAGDTTVLEHEAEMFVVPVFKEAEFLIAVRGSSMYPKYNSGDIVACKKLPLDTFFQWNKVYVLDTSQGALIKRVSKSENPDHILIVSDNEKYPPFDLHRSEIRALAIVLGVIRLE
jgi:phage repressor protein C with HTH and peptisase S24 domain